MEEKETPENPKGFRSPEREEIAKEMTDKENIKWHLSEVERLSKIWTKR